MWFVNLKFNIAFSDNQPEIYGIGRSIGSAKFKHERNAIMQHQPCHGAMRQSSNYIWSGFLSNPLCLHPYPVRGTHTSRARACVGSGTHAHDESRYVQTLLTRNNLRSLPLRCDFILSIAETFPLLNCTVLAWQADSASCSQGISVIANAQKVAASTLFLCLYRYSNSAAHEDCPR